MLKYGNQAQPGDEATCSSTLQVELANSVTFTWLEMQSC